MEMISKRYLGEEGTSRGQERQHAHHSSLVPSSSKLGVLPNDQPRISAARATHLPQLPSGYLLRGPAAGPAGPSSLVKFWLTSEQTICQERGILANYMVTEGDLILGGGHTMQYIGNVSEMYT